jgi:SAM-dependent methyltransferase
MSTKCWICGNAKKFISVHSYDKPDKYEKWMDIKDVNRCWVRCMKCGFYIHVRGYNLSELEPIYKSGYRDEKFRGEPIQHAFDRITTAVESENEARYLWFAMNVTYTESRKVLDIGSGIGVWPWLLKRAEYDVACVEENEISINFIKTKLDMTCFDSIDAVLDQYDTVTLVHVLEHIEHPIAFLRKVKKLIRKGGNLYVEVPDSIEFTYLDKDHDEFNSCHVAFYNMGSLYRVIEASGLTVTDMHVERTKERNLSRVMCLAVN